MIIPASVSALVLLTAVSAEAQSPGANAPSVPPEAERLPRTGLFAEGFPVAIGIVRSDTGATTKTGLALGGSLGGGLFLDPSTSIGIRFANATYVSDIEIDSERTTQRFALSALAGADRYLHESVWIGAAAGYAWVIDVVSDNSEAFGDDNFSSSGGFAVNARAGLDFYPLRRGALRLAVDGTAAFIDDTTVVTAALHIGFHVY